MNEERKIILDTNLEHLDLWRYYINVYFKLSIGIYICFCLLLFGMALLLMFSAGEWTFNQLERLLVLSFLFTLLFIFFLIYTSAELSVERNLKVKYIISNEGIETIGEDFSSEIKWSYFSRIKEINNHLLIDNKEGNPIIIPKRYFSDQNELLEFKEVIRENFKGEIRLKKPKEKLGLK